VSSSAHRNVVVSLAIVMAGWLGLYVWAVIGLWKYLGWLSLLMGAYLTAGAGFSLAIGVALFLLSWWIVRNLIERSRR
jgi:hypothetical protein